VADPVWSFERGEELLTLCRQAGADGPRLVVTINGKVYGYRFADIEELLLFQIDVEGCLVESGWSFVAFSGGDHPAPAGGLPSPPGAPGSAERCEDRLVDGAGHRSRAAGKLDRDVLGRRERRNVEDELAAAAL
jgi:hypothetical protein